MKFKAKIKDSHLVVRTKISSQEEISEREFFVLEKRAGRGFLKPCLIKKRYLEYTGPAGHSLMEHLKKPVTKYEFFYIMAQIIDTSKKIQMYDLFLSNLVLDLHYVFINEFTKELQFVYLPIGAKHLRLDILEFMKSIVYCAKPNEESSDYIAKFQHFLKTQEYFRVGILEQYISKQDKDVAMQIKKQNVGYSDFITDKPQHYYEHYEPEDVDDTALLDEYVTTLLYEDEATGLLSEDEMDATGLLDDGDATTVLCESNEDTLIRQAYLLRVSTNTNIYIDKRVFRIGKEQSCVDYVVSDNPAISRSHADIITRGDHYFVYDHQSTNHTYIDDEELDAHIEIEIQEGSTLTLADEAFVFHT